MISAGIGSSDDEPVRKKPEPKTKAPKYEEIDDGSDDGECSMS